MRPVSSGSHGLDDSAGWKKTPRSALALSPLDLKRRWFRATIIIRANPFTNTGTIEELNGGSFLINP